jgi:hypothetical protein
METLLHNENSLRAFSDNFVTFLYAAAVHLIIADFARPAPITVQRSIAVLFLILFVLSDWLSRMRLPRLLPTEDRVSIRNQLLKTTLEISGLFFLVLAWLALIESFSKSSEAIVVIDHSSFWTGPLTPDRAFALFLVATFLWNLLMLLVMRKIGWRDLVRMGISGSALDSDKVKPYATRFWLFWQKLETRVRDDFEQGSHRAPRNFLLAQPVLLLEAFVRTGAQIVVHHIAWTNILAAMFILVKGSLWDAEAVVHPVQVALEGVRANQTIEALLIFLAVATLLLAITVRMHGWKICAFHLCVTLMLLGAILSVTGFALALVLGCPTLLFYLASWCEERTRQGEVWRTLAGTVGFLLLVGFYFMLEPKVLMFLVAGQQVIVNVFLQYAASNSLSGSDNFAPTGGLGLLKPAE